MEGKVPSCDHKSWFAAEWHAYTTSSAAAHAATRCSATNASSVMFTADVGIRKLKSDLFLQRPLSNQKRVRSVTCDEMPTIW